MFRTSYIHNQEHYIVHAAIYGMFSILKLQKKQYTGAYRGGRSLGGSQIATHHVTRINTSLRNILSTAPQLSIAQKALGTLPENGNVLPKHVGATIHN
jgi:hypothetical protein